VRLYDITGIANLIGTVLIFVFFIPWRGRPPRNKAIGYIGFALVFVAAVVQITLRVSGGL
jgi:hypothetical protein